jgi:hypothetical protein
MAQVFHADPRHSHTFLNGAVGYRSDCLGPYAKVKNCPITGTDKRLTCYATGYADTYFSIPACTRYRGKHVRGYFTGDNGNIEFRVMDSHKHLFNTEV